VSGAPGLIRSPRSHVKPDPSSRIRIVPLYRSISVAQSLHDVPSRQFPPTMTEMPHERAYSR
jgi:hypothetical protein